MAPEAPEHLNNTPATLLTSPNGKNKLSQLSLSSECVTVQTPHFFMVLLCVFIHVLLHVILFHAAEFQVNGDVTLEKSNNVKFEP